MTPRRRPAARRWTRGGGPLGTGALLLALAACGSEVAGAAGEPPSVSAARQVTAEPTAAGNWRTVWREDFAGPAGSAPAATDWRYALGSCEPGCPAPHWGTGEVATMTSSAVALDGAGHLGITPVRSPTGWISGRIETRRADFAPPAGGILRVEAALRQPEVTAADGGGYWPAFWLLGAPFRDRYTSWPGTGEIDVMEAINGRESVFAAVHCGWLPGGPCREPVGLSSGEHPCPGCRAAFHRYAVELDTARTPQQLRWYLDGRPYFAVTADQVGTDTWARAMAHGFYVILDVNIGGGFPAALGGQPSAATAAGRPLLVDYVVISTRRPAG